MSSGFPLKRVKFFVVLEQITLRRKFCQTVYMRLVQKGQEQTKECANDDPGEPKQH